MNGIRGCIQQPGTGETGKVLFLTLRSLSLGSDLELASLCHVFYSLEWLVLLPIHIQAIHLQS